VILRDAVMQLADLDRRLTICVRRPWSGDAECVLVVPDAAERLPPSAADNGFAYFLEVFVALEAIEVFAEAKPTLDEKVRLLVFYAENDAYPEWVYETPV
jgi:hypothetical protein